MDNMQNKPLVSFILPVYQAESFISGNLQRFSEFCAGLEYESEIIVINDGSTDRTDDIIKRYLKESTNGVIKYISLKKNVGKGATVKKGVEESKGSYLVFTDWDLQYSFKDITNVANTMIKSNTDIVIANRIHKDSIFKIRSTNLPWLSFRYLTSRIYNKLINLFLHLDIKDTQAGLKGFKRDTATLIFKKMTVKGFGFDIDILTCAREHDKKITDIPIELNYDLGTSTIRFWRQAFVMISDLMHVFFKKFFGYYRK